MGDRNNVYYNYYPHWLLNETSTDEKKMGEKKANGYTIHKSHYLKTPFL